MNLGICIFPLRTLRLCGEKEVLNLGILGNLAHFRQLNFLWFSFDNTANRGGK